MTAKSPMEKNCTLNSPELDKSPMEKNCTLNSTELEQRVAMAKRYSYEGVIAGAKAAVVASVATAIPIIASTRMFPWAKANLKPVAQALIISTVGGMAYFIVADKTILAMARKNSFKSKDSQ